MLRGELGFLDGLVDVVVAPDSLGLGVEVCVEGLDLEVEAGVVGTGDGDFADDLTDCSSSDFPGTAPVAVLV